MYPGCIRLYIVCVMYCTRVYGDVLRVVYGVVSGCTHVYEGGGFACIVVYEGGVFGCIMGVCTWVSARRMGVCNDVYETVYTCVSWLNITLVYI